MRAGARGTRSEKEDLAHRYGTIRPRGAGTAAATEPGSVRRRDVRMKRKEIGNRESIADGRPASAEQRDRTPGSTLDGSDSRFPIPNARVIVRRAGASDLPAILSLRMA